jgi:hypothetical protein
MIPTPRFLPRSGLSSQATLLLVLAAAGTLLYFFLFSRTPASRAAARTPVPAASASPAEPAVEGIEPAAELAPALVLPDVEPEPATPAPETAAALAVASAVPAPVEPVADSRFPAGPKLKHFRNPGKDKVDVRALKSKQRAQRKERQAARAAEGTQPAQPALDEPRNRWSEPKPPRDEPPAESQDG